MIHLESEMPIKNKLRSFAISLARRPLPTFSPPTFNHAKLYSIITPVPPFCPPHARLNSEERHRVAVPPAGGGPGPGAPPRAAELRRWTAPGATKRQPSSGAAELNQGHTFWAARSGVANHSPLEVKRCPLTTP